MTTHIVGEKRPLEVFLVEDNLSDALLTREALRRSKLNIHLTIARDGEEALDRLRQGHGFAGQSFPDLILLDLNLPKKDGQQVLTEIKDDPSLKETPVLIWTSSSDDRDRQSAYQHHANLFLVKPGNIDEFFATFKYIEEFWLGKMDLTPYPETRKPNG